MCSTGVQRLKGDIVIICEESLVERELDTICDVIYGDEVGR